MDKVTKDPESVLDYTFDWRAYTNGTGKTDWLASGETISAKTITATTGITVDSSALSDNDTSVTVWLSGGTDGRDYVVGCKIATDGGRTDKRSIVVQCRER
jgi:hypothetical protein